MARVMMASPRSRPHSLSSMFEVIAVELAHVSIALFEQTQHIGEQRSKAIRVTASKFPPNLRDVPTGSLLNLVALMEGRIPAGGGVVTRCPEEPDVTNICPVL